MRNPIRIIVEYRFRKILLLKLVISIDDRLHMIFIFYDMQPCQNIRLKFFNRQIGWSPSFRWTFFKK